MDLYRSQPNGSEPTLLGTVPNTGAYSDRTPWTGKFTVDYKICETGTDNCSNQIRVKF